MEAAEDASLEAAIGWLVQTILVSLLAAKLEAWIRQAGLADDIDRLKSEVERVEMVVAAVKGRAIGNKPLARSLARLKELLYDADDVVDELDYYRLQQQVEGVSCGGDPESMQAAEERLMGSVAEDIPSGSGGSLRSRLWKDFEVTKWDNGKAIEAKCIHCSAPPIKCGSSNGTSVLKNHLKSKGCIRKRVVIGNSFNRKRRRTDKDITTTANAHTLWNKAELNSRISKITSQIHDIQGEVSDFLKILGLDSATCSVHRQSTTSVQYLKTSSLVQKKVYGRVAEKNSIMNLMTKSRSDGVTILSIVGIAGIGKTALAQHVYNDLEVKKQFQRIWVSVSYKFDEVRLTKEMLDFVSPDIQQEGSLEKTERHEGISSFGKLQEILKGRMEFQSKRFLLILDDVWDNLDNYRWNKLVTPLVSGHVKGNVIIVTTRNLSVAQRIGTLKPINLGALENDDFWLLFKSHAFGDENYEGHQCLSVIGKEIVEKLKGNPLAAISTGDLLREKLETDHWSNILKNDKWKSLQLYGGIMPAFKLSYDQLPYHLQQCFSYCSIFPYNHEFLDEELVRIWISQGFVKCKHSSQRLEEIGWCYLTDLVNLGFFQQVKKEESFVGSKIWYAMCGLMHDFARMVSRTECAIIDGLQYNEMLPSIQHLSIVTDSAYIKDQYGNITRNKDFEENLRDTVTSVRKLRTVVLIGNYDPFFFKSFQDIFQKAQNLRLLQMSAISADFNAFMCSLINPVHLRYLKHSLIYRHLLYLKRRSDEVAWALPQVLSKFYHLQMLNLGLKTDLTTSNGMNTLVSLQHLVAEEEVHSSIGRIGQMTSLQELKDFSVQESSGFEITQLQSMNELVHLGVSQLKNVKSREEAYGAKLRDKRHLEKLYLSWKRNDTLSQDEYFNDISSELWTTDGRGSSSYESCLYMIDVDEVDITTYDSGPTYAPSMNKDLSLMDDIGPSAEPSIGTATEVLEGLEPNPDLKHLHISGYNGTSPTWLASNMTSLQTLHLEDCGKWEILPSLERLTFLTKLKLRNMRKVIEVLVPSLEELVLVNMPMLERCSCTYFGDLNSSLRELQIENCHALRVFDLVESYHKFEIEQKSWLPGLRKFTIRNCPVLEVLNPFPLSTTSHELHISGISTLPRMEGTPSQALTIGFKGFSQLVFLRSLEIDSCGELFSWHVMSPGHTHEDMTAANWKAFPSLESLTISSCRVMGEWLSLMLRHAPVLEVLDLQHCRQITQVLIQEGEDSQSDLTSAHTATAGPPDVALTGSTPIDDLNFISSLKNIFIAYCPDITFNMGKKGWSRFTSLEKLKIGGCPQMLPSLVHKYEIDDRANGRWLLPQSLRELEIYCESTEILQLCFIGNQTCLTKLDVSYMPGLKSLQLHSCRALEGLTIKICELLVALEGLQSLGRLRCLEIDSCPSLHPWLERLSMQGPELCPRLSRLEKLCIDGTSLLTVSFCKHLSSLQFLELSDWHSEMTQLTDEQVLALQLLSSLQELKFGGFKKLVDLPAELNRLFSLKKLRMWMCNGVSKLSGMVLPTSLQELHLSYCGELVDLPGGLHTHPSLRKLSIWWCNGISRLPAMGLPHSLEILDISGSNDELGEECRKLATRNLKVKINWEWIN